MKAHAYRLLTNLPDLCRSPLVWEVRARFHGEVTEPIKEAVLDQNSIYLRVVSASNQLRCWLAFDRDAIESIAVILNLEACSEAAVEPRLDALLLHLDTKRKGKTP